MLPANSATGPLSKLRRNGAAVAWDRRTVKGVDYVVFKAAAGNYTATYATDATAPEISGINVQADNEGRATVTWTTDEPASSKRRVRPHGHARLRDQRHRARQRPQARADGPGRRHHVLRSA